jgi:hypothetical protein
MPSRSLCTILLILLVWAVPCAAAKPAIYKVEVKDTVDGGDVQGAALVYALKEQIRSSAGFSLDSTGTRYVIFITTFDPAVGGQAKGMSTSYAAAFCVYDAPTKVNLFLRLEVGTAGDLRVDAAAKSLLATLDKLVPIEAARTPTRAGAGH